jgi:hypothetical protein
VGRRDVRPDHGARTLIENTKNLNLSIETVRQLDNNSLAAIAGGRYYPETVGSCYTHCMCTSVVADPTVE